MSDLTLPDQCSMLEALQAAGPAADRGSAMMLYGQFVGSWDGTVVVRHNYRVDAVGETWFEDSAGTPREASCEVHFGWALQGRAVQDVWIAPSRHARTAGAPDLMYGTTLRVYDPPRDLWHITWIDPVTRAFARMTANRVGEDIVQEYRPRDGMRRQWLFTEITAGSFHWLSRDSMDDGATWRLRVEFFLRRRKPNP